MPGQNTSVDARSATNNMMIIITNTHGPAAKILQQLSDQLLFIGFQTMPLFEIITEALLLTIESFMTGHCVIKGQQVFLLELSERKQNKENRERFLLTGIFPANISSLSSNENKKTKTTRLGYLRNRWH